MRRREFLKNSTGASVLAGLGFADFAEARSGGNVLASRATAEAGDSTAQIGRPVRVVSIGFKARGSRLEKIVEVVDGEGVRGSDVIVLPEACRGMGDEGSTETLSGPTVTAMAALAKKHRTYIICPIDRKDGKGRHNSAVLLDRGGQVAAVYNKIFPWFPEFRVSPSVEPGKEVGVHQADFGRLGLAICFD